MSGIYDIDGTTLNSAIWNDKLDKYTIPREVTEIADARDGNLGAFSQFKNKKFTVAFSSGSQIQIIGAYSFYGCTLLQSIDFTNANQLIEIRRNAFQSCTTLKTITLPKSLEILGYGAFIYCSSLSQVTFPKGSQLTTINSEVFYTCPLTSFQFPKKVNAQNTLGAAFRLTQIGEFTIEDDDGENLAIFEGSVYSKDFSVLYVYNKGTEFKLHQGTTTLTYCSFSGSKCPHVILPETITDFGNAIFFEFLGKKITMLSTPETISDSFFRDCINLEELVLFEGLKSITYSTRQVILTNGRLKSIYIPYSLESIDPKSIDIKDFKACFYGNVEVLKRTFATLTNYKVNDCYIGIKISIINNRHIFLSKSISNFLFVLSSSL